jgi:hypothetical protein
VKEFLSGNPQSISHTIDIISIGGKAPVVCRLIAEGLVVFEAPSGIASEV